jgi:hypothetical protein
MKKCANCQKVFEGNKLNKKYCSNGCKQEAYRKRNNIPVPFETLKEKSSPVQMSGFTPLLIKNTSQSYKALLLHEREFYVNTLNTIQKNIFPTVTLGLGGVGAVVGKDTTSKLLFGVAGALVGHGIDQIRQDNANRELDKAKDWAIRRINDIDQQLKEIQRNEQTMKALTKTSVLSKPDEEGVQVFEPLNLKEAIPILGKMKGAAAQKIVSLSELNDMSFPTLSFSGEWEQTFGHPQSYFKMMIYGESGNGKSYYAARLAEYLANNHGKVLYNAAEEGLNKSLQLKMSKLKSKYMDIGSYTNFEELKAVRGYRYLVIDSVNEMQLKPSQLRELCEMDKKRGIIYIMQVTKGGDFRGDNQFKHDADIIVKVEDRVPKIEKNRYA